LSHLNTWENKGLYRKFENKISGEEVLTSNLTIQGDPRFDDIRYVINDFTQIVDFEVSGADINIIAATDNAAAISNPSIKIAIVSTHDPLLAWIKHYCEIMKDAPFECKIFDNINDTYKWVSDH